MTPLTTSVTTKSFIIQKTDKGTTVFIIDWASYIKEIEKKLSDTINFVKPKHKVNNEIGHLLDIESSIKNWLDDLFNHSYLSKED